MDTDLQPMMDLLPEHQFGKSGRALSQEELKQLARRKGLCEICGVVKTHSSGNSSSKLLAAVRRKQPVTDDDAWQGICIRCHRHRVPAEVAAAWEQRNKDQLDASRAAAAVTNSSEQSSLSNAAAAAYPSSPRSGPTGGYDSSPQSRRQLLSGPGMATSSPAGNSNTMSRTIPLSARSVRRTAVVTRTTPVPPMNDGSERAKHARRQLMLRGTGRFRSESSDSTASEMKSIQISNSSAMSSVAVNDSAGELTSELHDPIMVLKASSQNAKFSEDEIRRALTDIRDAIPAEEDAVSPPNVLMQLIKDVADRHRWQTDLVTAATGAIFALSASSANDVKEWIVHSGIIRTLIDILKTTCDTVDAPCLSEDQGLLLEWVLGALTSIAHSCDRNCKRKAAIAQNGGIEATLRTLEQYSIRASILEWSCRCLYNLVYSYDKIGGDDETDGESNIDNEIRKNIATLGEAGGIQIVLASMKSHISESVALLWAMKLLWRLHGRQEEEARRISKLLAECEFFPFATKVLRARSTSRDLFQITSELMCTTLHARIGEEDTMFDSALSECIPSVVRLMGEDSNNVCILESGCRLLSTLCLARNANRVQSDLKEFGTVAAITDAMEKLSDNASLLEIGSLALWECSSIDSFLDASQVRKAALVMARAAGTHKQGPAARTLLMSFCGVTANCCDLLGNEEIDFLVEVVASVFENHSDDKVVCDQAVRALAQLCASLPECAVRIILSLNCQHLVQVCGESLSMTNDLFAVAAFALTDPDNAGKYSFFTDWLLNIVNMYLSNTADSREVEELLDLIASLEASLDPLDVALPDGMVQKICDYAKDLHVQPEVRVKSFAALLSLMNLANLTFKEVQVFVNSLEEVVDLTSRDDDTVLQSGVCHILWAVAAEYQDECMLQPALRCVDTMFTEVVKVLKKHSSPEAAFQSDVIGLAAGALASITAIVRRNRIPVDHEIFGVIAESAYKVLECKSDGAETLVNFLIAILNLCSIAHEALVQSGAIVLVVDVLTEQPENELIQQVGCSILSALSSTGTMLVRFVIAETEGIDALANALANFPLNVHIQSEACKAFSNLSTSAEMRALILSQNGFALSATALKAHVENESLALNACSTLYNLVSDTDGQISSDTGVVDALARAMSSFPSSVVLQKKCVAVFKEIAIECFTITEQLGVIEALLPCVQHFMGVPSIMEPAFLVLGKVASVASNQVKIIEEQGVAHVVNGMLSSMDSKAALIAGCSCLESLSSPKTRLSLWNFGVVDTIILAMRAHFDSQALQTVACRALATVTAPGVTGEPFIVEGDELNAITSLMRRYPGCEFLQEQGCVVLCNVLASPKNSDVFKRNEAEIKYILSKAASSFPAACSERAELILTCFS